MIISIDAEKAFDKIQHPFMMNTQQCRNRGNIPKHNEDYIYDKPTTNIILNRQKLQVFPLTLGTRQRMSAFPSLIPHSTESPSHRNQTKRRNKRHPNWKGRSKTPIIADNMILYIQNPKNSTKKSLGVINEFSKIAGY